MTEIKQEWDKYVTPKTSTSKDIQCALNWWHELPIQNLYDMSDSRVGYFWKYYPEKTNLYFLTKEEVHHIYESEHTT